MTDVNSEEISSSEPDRDQMIEKFYREHSRELWGLFYGMCSDPERAYDAVQESFLRFHDYRGGTCSRLAGVVVACWAKLAAGRGSKKEQLLSSVAGPG